MTATSTSTADQERVHEIVRQKSLLVLGMAKQSFAGDIAAQIRLGQLELSGIELDGENDTVSVGLRGRRGSSSGGEDGTHVLRPLTVPVHPQKPTRSAQATITCHLEVTPACCNIRGNAHGGFLAWLVDQCSSLSLLALSGPGERWISSGVSTNLNVNYISAAPVSPCSADLHAMFRFRFSSEPMRLRRLSECCSHLMSLQVGTKLAITTSVLQQGRVTGLLETRIVNE